MKCVIFRCSKKAEMYLYVPTQDDEDALLKNLPEGLERLTGRLEKVMHMELTPDRKLARANAREVIAALQDKGYYLQTPPNEVFLKDQTMLNNDADGF